MPTAPTPPIKDIVISSEDPELIEILKEIKQTLDIREGRLGDTNFRFIDYYELIELLAGDETITITVLPGAHSHPHNETTAKQGAGPEYYHLTLAEYGALGAIPAHNDTTGKQGGTAGEYYHLTATEYGNLHPPDIITEGNSSVEVVDTGTGQVDITIDGQVVGQWKSNGLSLLGTNANVLIGQNDLVQGTLFILGGTGGIGAGGGTIYIYNDAANDSNAENFGIEANGGNLRIGPNTDYNALKFDTAIDEWIFKHPIQFVDGQLITNIGTPIDLTINCGTDKTVKLTEGVWKDTNVGGAQLNPIPAFAPDLEKFLDEGGGDTGIYTLAFAVNESASGSFEIQHDYKEGTDISFHIHWQGIAAPSGTDFVKWELTYTIVRFDATIDASTVIVIETAIDTQYKNNTSVFPIISGSTGGNNGGPIQMGDQFLLTARRIAAAGDAYLGDALVLTAGLHYEVDTLGSRQIGVK